jgi:hypothetical protein
MAIQRFSLMPWKGQTRRSCGEVCYSVGDSTRSDKSSIAFFILEQKVPASWMKTMKTWTILRFGRIYQDRFFNTSTVINNTASSFHGIIRPRFLTEFASTCRVERPLLLSTPLPKLRVDVVEIPSLDLEVSTAASTEN